MLALVTGGGGFLGRAIVERLLARGDSVRILGRSAVPDLAERGVDVRRGDVADARTVDQAVAGCDVVFHVAARIGSWGHWHDYFATNVLGTRHVIAGCRRHGVGRLVYTSTPSVVHGGGDLDRVDESAPYATRFDAHYPRSKAMAEREVLAASDATLATVALRPHLIWGPGDTQMLPRAVERARRGRLRLPGGPPKLVDAVYVDNAADAHILAWDRLAPGAPCAGRPYFISQGQPLPAGELINRVLGAAGVPPVTRRISPRMVYVAGCVAELTYGLLRIQREPPVTRFVARQLTTAHHYDLSAARRDLGYEPSVSMEEGLARLRAWYAGGSCPQQHRVP